MNGQGDVFLRTSTYILTGILAGIYSAILDGFEQDYGLNPITSALIITVSTILTGYLLHKIGSNKKTVDGGSE